MIPAQGREEREASYTPLKDALVEHFSNISVEERFNLYFACPIHFPQTHKQFYAFLRHNLHVLVPGAGLGRLAFDVAKLGDIRLNIPREGR